MKHSCEGVCIIIGVDIQDVALIVNTRVHRPPSASLVVCRHSALTPPTSPMCNYYSVESVGVPTLSIEWWSTWHCVFVNRENIAMLHTL